MAVLKRFSYDNIVEHNPNAPDPVDYEGGGVALDVDQLSYSNTESVTIAGGDIASVTLDTLSDVPFEYYYSFLKSFGIIDISGAQLSIMAVNCLGSTVIMRIKNLSDSELTIRAYGISASYVFISMDE